MKPDKHGDQKLIDFSNREHLGKIAQKICDKLEIERKFDLIHVTQKDVDGLNLQDWPQV